MGSQEGPEPDARAWVDSIRARSVSEGGVLNPSLTLRAPAEFL
jgi:hypothetical protein